MSVSPADLAGRSAGRHARVWRLAAPIILSGLSVPLLGAVDTAVVGRLPDAAYIGGVALGAMIFDFLYWGFGFLRMATSGFAAQAHGAGDAVEMADTLDRSLILAFALGAAILALQWPAGRLAFSLLSGSPEVEAQAHLYFTIRVWSAPATLGVYALLGWLLGRQRTDLVLAIELALNATNILLDLLFVLGFGWGVAGVATASVLAEYAALAAGLGLIGRLGHRFAWRQARVRLFARDRLTALLSVNGNVFLRTLSLVFATALFTAIGARLGDETLAANAILMNFFAFISYGLDGFAHTAQAMVGSAIGARSRLAYRQAVRDTTLWAVILAAGAALLLALAGSRLIELYSVNEAVRGTAKAALPWMVAMPLLAVWCFQLDGIFIGATRSREMRNGMILALLGELAALWILVPLWGNHGLWLSMTLFVALRGITLGLWLPRIGRSLPHEA
jgi:MATE family multidrug resistance protein